MRSPTLFCMLTPAVLLLPCFASVASAQEPSAPQTVATLSEPMPATLYPEAWCAHCIMPEWDRGYLLHREFDKDPAVVTMYDRSGKKVLETRVVPQNTANVSLIVTGATHGAGILAAGRGIMTDGSGHRFIARTDPSGRSVQSVDTGRFTTRHVCEASDGTVWALGYDLDIHDSSDADRNMLRHYSFQKGLLGAFVSLDSIAKFPDSYAAVANSGRSYLHCGKEAVSVYLAPVGQYIEVDASSERVSRWSVDMSSAVGSQTRGFAVTDEGRIFVAFANDPDRNGERKHGLYELRAMPGSPVAFLVAVDGTVSAFDSYKVVPDGTLLRLWGADENSLVVSRKGDGWGLSWAKVLAANTTAE